MKWLIPVIISIAGIAIPFFSSSINGPQKSLSYEVISSSEIKPPSIPVLNGLTVHLGNQQLENIGITLLELTNNGNVPINRNDFDSPLVIALDKDSRLLRSGVESKTPKDLDILLSEKENSVVVEPILLNPNDSFVIQLVTTGVMPEPSVKARISGISKAEKIISMPEKPNPIVKGAMSFALLCIYGGIGAIVIKFWGVLRVSEIIVAVSLN